MRIEYEIKQMPDPENPHEQPAGDTITDDRLYGKRVAVVSHSGQSYTKDFFAKPTQSNRLTLQSAVAPGITVIIDTL